MVSDFSIYSGTQFLVLYGALLLLAVLASFYLARSLRPQGRGERANDRFERAFLSGGSGRVTETVVARLLSVEALVPRGSNKLLVVHDRSLGEDRAENAVLRIPGEFGMTKAHEAVLPFAEGIEERLIARELLLDSGQRWRLRLASALPLVVLLAIGLYRARAGLAEGEPIGILAVLLVVTAVIAIWRFLKLDPRTCSGIDALAQARTHDAHLRTAPPQRSLPDGVALFGTAILVGTPLSELHAMRQSASVNGSGAYVGDGGGGSDGDSGGDGGSGCGGGCGGCGG